MSLRWRHTNHGLEKKKKDPEHDEKGSYTPAHLAQLKLMTGTHEMCMNVL